MSAAKRIISISARYKVEYLARRYGISIKRAKAMLGRYGHKMARLESAARSKGVMLSQTR
jgi:hypothetical protein